MADQSTSAPTVPDVEQVLDGLRAALTAVLDPADLAKIDLPGLDAGTALLSLPVDSLALMGVMTQLEDTFRVYIPEEQAYKFSTVGEVIDYIRARAAAKAARKRT